MDKQHHKISVANVISEKKKSCEYPIVYYIGTSNYTGFCYKINHLTYYPSYSVYCLKTDGRFEVFRLGNPIPESISRLIFKANFSIQINRKNIVQYDRKVCYCSASLCLTNLIYGAF